MYTYIRISMFKYLRIDGDTDLSGSGTGSGSGPDSLIQI